VLARFAQVASDPQYRNLAQRGEFQATYGVIRAYAAALAADGPARLSLPPPPGAERR
jgi:hypothetical protein